MLGTKVMVEELPVGGADHEERRLFNERGEMAQILNQRVDTFRHLVYWDLDTSQSGEERGHHYHKRETEHFYIVTGEAEILLEDLETGEKATLPVKAGTRVDISPGVAHAYRSLGYCQVLEWSPDPYDPSDTYPHKVVL